MTLLITILAAIASTIAWYFSPARDTAKLGILTLMYWGASIMWFVDSIVEYVELQANFFVPAPEDMINDAFLGICVVALGLVVWLIILMASDPKKVLRKKLTGQK